MRGLKGEAVQHQRVFKFFGTQLSELLPISREVGAGLAGVFAGVGSGMWVLAGIEAVKLGMAAFGEGAKETTQHLEEMKKKAEETKVEIMQLGRELGGLQKFSAPELERNTLERLKSNATDFGYEASLTQDPSEKKLAQNRARESADAFAKAGGDVRLDQLKEVIRLQQRIADNETNKKAAEERKRAAEQEAEALEKINSAIRTNLQLSHEKGNLDYEMAGGDGGVLLAAQQLEAEKLKLESARIAEEIRNLEVAGDYGGYETPGGLGEIADKNIQHANKVKEGWSAIGPAISQVMTSIGSAIGGTAGEFVSATGRMIEQAIALIVALTASDSLMTGPAGIFAAIPAAAGILAAVIGMIGSVPSFAVGTSFVPETGLAMVHRGERIITAEDNARGGGGGNVTIYASALDASWWRSNERHIVRTLQEAARGGRA
jgi:hypothetical protein